MKTELTVRGLEKTFQNAKRQIKALGGLSLEAKSGDFISIVGPSGCGKSTLLNCIAGFIKPTKGEIVFGREPKLGVVFQDRLLFPWLNVKENIGFGLKLQNEEKSDERISHWVSKVGLKGFEEAYPHELSIGMQQRVGIARAFTTKPRILLLDEPFSSVDHLTRLSLQEALAKLWESTKTTTIFVTHDIDEAIFLGEKLLVLSKRPAKIKKEMEIDLPRPRDTKTLTSKRFIKIKSELLQTLKED